MPIVVGARAISPLRRQFQIDLSHVLVVGELINRLSADTVEMGKSFSGMTLSTGLRSVTQFTAALSIMMYLSPALSAVRHVK